MLNEFAGIRKVFDESLGRDETPRDTRHDILRITERPRPLNPGKAISMAICIIIVYFIFYDNCGNSRALIG